MSQVLLVVNELNLLRPLVHPDETQLEPVVYPDAALDTKGTVPFASN